MTKRKKEPQKESKVTTKMFDGKITKAKNKEILMETSTRKVQVKLTRTPLVQGRSTKLPYESNSATPFLAKCLPKWTSTPVTTTSKPQESKSRSGRLIKKNLKYNDYAAPASPILGDISNLIKNRSNVDRNKNSVEGEDENKNKENASPSPPKTDRESRVKLRLSMRAQKCAKRTRAEPLNCLKSIPSPKKPKVAEYDQTSSNTYLRNNPGRITRRRSFGVQKVTAVTETRGLFEAQRQYKDNRCSNLRVQLSRCPLNESHPTLLNISSTDKSPDSVNPNTISRQKSSLPEPKDVTLVKRLRDDWSTMSCNETPSQMQQIRDEIIPLRAAKRRLSPLIELSSYESNVSTLKNLAPTSAKPNEEAYSSSAEFESDDEKENSRSKRAPTWKDLSNKSTKSAPLAPNSFSMKVRVRRLRSHTKSRAQEPNEAGDSVSNKDTEVLNGEQKIEEVPSNNPEEAILTYKEVPSQERDQQETEVNISSEEPAATEQMLSPSSKPQNLLHKSDVIEHILSSFAYDDVQHASSTNKTTSNCTRKFFTSPRDHTMAVPKTVEPPKGRRTSGRNKKRASIYEFLSQSSSDSLDPVADVIQKMINNGKVVVAKHKKGSGKLVVPRRRRKVAAKKTLPKANDVFVRPNPPPPPVKPQPTVEKSVEAVPLDDDGGVHYDDEEPIRDQRGFSKLARSAMIKHAGKTDNTSQRKMITDKQQLLAMAQKFVGQSTPVRVSSPSNATAQFSPIAGGASPWRVDDDTLPNIFYFNRNSDNLPSFSSDYIPSTPSKNKSKSTSSFSSNDSNGENVAPPSAPSSENHTQMSSNPRRALSYRSPLKAINILEVVHLPPLAMNRSEKDAPKESCNRDKSGKPCNDRVSNLFGFEDMIEDDEDDVDVTHQPLITGKENIKKQMQRLKRLRTQIPKATTSRNNCIKPVFDDVGQKQKTVKQMFSSTMIERQSIEPNNGALEKTYFNDTGSGDLFKDPEPETTFDQSTARRSYSRPFKRKRKLRHNFVMFMDSDASEEEDDEVADKNYRKKPKEQHKKAPKENLELDKFVNEFNEMYKEVSEYELIVE